MQLDESRNECCSSVGGVFYAGECRVGERRFNLHKWVESWRESEKMLAHFAALREGKVKAIHCKIVTIFSTTA